LRAELHNELTDIPITRGGKKISHLFFDILLFCRANLPKWLKIQEVLKMYEEASSKKINMEKTSIFFSKNMKADTRDHLLVVLGVGSSSCYEKYLGLPALVGRSRIRSFQNIQDRIWSRINGWKERFLSQTGKEVLLKAAI
jgi:hypothetical protein